MNSSEHAWTRRLAFRDTDETLLGWLNDLRSGNPETHAAAVNSLLDSMMDSLTSIIQQRHHREARLSARFYSHSDLVQDVCLRLFKALSMLAEQNPEKLPDTIELLEGLVRFHVRCAFHDVFRRVYGKNKPGARHESARFRGGSSTGASTPEKHVAANGPGPGTVLLNEEERRRLPEAVAALPEAQREVCELKYFTGMSTPEIAWMLGISERTVRDRTVKALEAMRRHLRPE